ncbi:MAG: SDR family oxidoreductase, partial [Rubrivivax sp.]|nr:SDR family oxidoreductase [Rubrivivax sp.]
HPGEVRREVTQEARLARDAHAADRGGLRLHLGDDFGGVVEVRLRVHAPREGQAHEFHAVVGLAAVVQPLAEHHRADLDAADAAFEVERGLTGMAHTTASRAGVIYLTKALAARWAPHGIRVHSVGPGAIESHGFNNYREEHRPTFYSSNPMLHAGDVQDIAQAVAWLAGPGAAMNGESLNVDGGMPLWGEFWPAGRRDYFKPRQPG